MDDGLVDTDKVGTSVYYWSFPRYLIFLKTILICLKKIYIYSKTKIAKKNTLDKAKSKLNEYEKKLNNNLETLKKERAGKETTDEKQTLLDKLKVLEEKKLQLENELKKHEKSNSVEYDHMKKSIKVRKVK